MFSFPVDENLKLVLPQPHMAEEITTLVRENLVHLRPWLPWAVDDYSIESATEFIKRSLAAFAENGRFEACILWNGKITGAIGFHNLDNINRSAHIGYWLAKEYEGNGIVTRCCRVLIDYLIENMDLHRLQINCNVDNVRSRTVPERLGFKLEGIHRHAEFLHDRFGDWAVYAMLRNEWKIENREWEIKTRLTNNL